MKTIVFVSIFVGILIGGLAGSFFTNMIVSSAAQNLAKDRFYVGMIVMCSVDKNFTKSDCYNLMNQAIENGYYEQSLGISLSDH